MDLKNALNALKEKHVTLVAFGDSITENNHWTLGLKNWVQLLESNLYCIFPKHPTVINSGLSGDSLPACLDRLERDVLRFQPDVVIVSFGTNDCVKKDPEGFRTMYRELLQKILATGAIVVTRTPTPLINMDNGSIVNLQENSPHCMLERYVEVIREVSAELDVYCIDHYAYWMKSASTKYRGEMMMLMGNTIHPNGHGHRRMYYELAPHFGLPPFHQEDFEHILWCNGDYKV